MALVESAGLAVDGVVRADREYLLDRALADQDVRAIAAFETRPTCAAARNRTESRRSCGYRSSSLELLVQFDMLQHGDVEQVLETGLVEAVQVGVFEDALRIPRRGDRGGASG